MFELVKNYLKYGFCKTENVLKYDRVVYEYDDIVYNLNTILKDSINELIPNPEEVVFQLSGGFDSTLITSYFNNPKTFCVSHEKSPDIPYSKRVSQFYNTSHSLVTEEELLSDIDVRETLIEMHSKINKLPRGHINDIYIYHVLKRLKEETDCIAGGEGTELLFIGYMNIYQKVIELSIANGDYNSKLANLYYRQSDRDFYTLNFKNVLSMSNRTLYTSVIDWWTSQFSDNEIEKLIDFEITYEDMDLHSVITYIYNLLGKEYYHDRKNDFCEYFNLRWISPFTEKEMIDYVMTLPIESKYCIKYPKYMLYESFNYRVPEFVYKRPKVGLRLSDGFFYSKKEEIELIVKEFLVDRNMKIYDYIDYDEAMNVVNNEMIHKIWSLLNLSIWMEINV